MSVRVHRPVPDPEIRGHCRCGLQMTRWNIRHDPEAGTDGQDAHRVRYGDRDTPYLPVS